MDRAKTNNILRNAGFRWNKTAVVVEDAYNRWVEYEWTLHDTTGFIVSVREAMERGAESGADGCADWLAQVAPTEGNERVSRVRGRSIPPGADERAYLEA